MSSKLRLGVLASGRGTNFFALLKAIKSGNLDAEAKVVISNKKRAGVLSIAEQNQIPGIFVSPKEFFNPDEYDIQLLNIFDKYGVDFIVLAGYLKLLSKGLVQKYRNRIINIHPALLPSFGGKGMYGHFVHHAVIERGCKVSGVTVHLVDEIYDHGPIILQRCVPVLENDTPESLAARVLEHEHKVFAEALQLFAENRVKIEKHRAIILDRSLTMDDRP